jgi:hypothetical protein
VVIPFHVAAPEPGLSLSPLDHLAIGRA